MGGPNVVEPAAHDGAAHVLSHGLNVFAAVSTLSATRRPVKPIWLFASHDT